ncbi:MAG: hypothetical protein V3V49_13940 [Candidatus Krumholzibacteria bacterium]
MTTQSRPRHIRDIAHLYLSRRHGAAPVTLSILVTSAGSECFSGLHVANLAMAFSERKIAVSVYELSGMLPNASFYLAHPPGVYLGTRGPDMFHPALRGVSLTFGTVPPPVADAGQRTARLNLFHLPPLRMQERLRESLKRAAGILSPERWMLLLHDNAGIDLSMAKWLRVEVGPQRTLTVRVGDPGPSLVPGAEHLGAIGGWRPRVVDRVPVVLREPRADVSLEYLSICDSVLSRLNRIARRNHAAAEVSTGNPAGG